MNRRKVLSMIGLAGLFPSVALGKSQKPETKKLSRLGKLTAEERQRNQKALTLAVCDCGADGLVYWKVDFTDEGLFEGPYCFTVRHNGRRVFCQASAFTLALVSWLSRRAYLMRCGDNANEPVRIKIMKWAILKTMEKWVILKSGEKWNERIPFFGGYNDWKAAVLIALQEEGLFVWEAEIAFGFASDTGYFGRDVWDWHRNGADDHIWTSRERFFENGVFPKMKIAKQA